MDHLALMFAYAAGMVALFFAARSPAAGWLTHTFAWTGGPYLALCFVLRGANTHALSLTEWTGEAQTGAFTLLVLTLALASPFIVDWDRDGRRG